MHAIFSPDSQGAKAFISMSVLITRKSTIPARRDAFKRFLMANIAYALARDDLAPTLRTELAKLLQA